MCELCRRSFLSGLAAVGTAGFMPKALAQGAIDARFERPNVTLPARGEFVITNATVITMDPQLGDILNGSVHVNDGAIVAIGANVSAPGATAIDAQGRVVMPGLIDTHWHMWHTLFRGMSGDKREDGFFPTVTRFSGSMSAQDMYASTRLAAVEAPASPAFIRGATTSAAARMPRGFVAFTRFYATLLLQCPVKSRHVRGTGGAGVRTRDNDGDQLSMAGS